MAHSIHEPAWIATGPSLIAGSKVIVPSRLAEDAVDTSRRGFLLKTLRAGAVLTVAGNARPYSSTSQEVTLDASGGGAPLAQGDDAGSALRYVGISDAQANTGNQPVSGALDNRIIQVNSILDMRAIDTAELVDGQQVSVKGYYAGSDVGGGIFYWDGTRAEDENGGTVFNVGMGRFRRIYTTPIDVCAFGAIPGGDRQDVGGTNRDALGAALRSVKSVKLVNYGERYHSFSCALDSDAYKGTSIIGEGLPEWIGSLSLQTEGVHIQGIVFDGSWQESNSNSHLVRMRQGGDYTIRGCHFKNLIIGTKGLNGSDGIYIRATSDLTGYHVRNVLIDNCKFYDIARQAITVIQGENIIIQNCYSSTRRAFVDVEPNGANELTRSVHVRDSYVDGERLGVTYIDEVGNDLDNINGQGYGIEFHNSSGPNPPNHNHHCSAENIYIIGNREVGGTVSPGLKARRTMCSFKNIYCKYLTGGKIFEFSGDTSVSNPITIKINDLYLIDSGSEGDQILESYNNDVSLVLKDSVFSNVNGYFRGTGLHKVEGCYFYNCGRGEKAFIFGYTTSVAPRHVIVFSENIIIYDVSSTPPNYFIQEPTLNVTREDTLLCIERNHVKNDSGQPMGFISARNVARNCIFSKNKLVNVSSVVEFRVDAKERSQLVISENDIILRTGSSINQGFSLNAMSSVKITNNHFTGGQDTGVPFLALTTANDYTISGNTFNATSRVAPYIRVLDSIGSAIIYGNTFLNPNGFKSTSTISADSVTTVVEQGLNVDRT